MLTSVAWMPDYFNSQNYNNGVTKRKMAEIAVLNIPSSTIMTYHSIRDVSLIYNQHCLISWAPNMDKLFAYRLVMTSHPLAGGCCSARIQTKLSKRYLGPQIPWVIERLCSDPPQGAAHRYLKSQRQTTTESE